MGKLLPRDWLHQNKILSVAAGLLSRAGDVAPVKCPSSENR